MGGKGGGDGGYSIAQIQADKGYQARLRSEKLSERQNDPTSYEAWKKDAGDYYYTIFPEDRPAPAGPTSTTPTDTTMPTQGDDAKTPGGDNTATDGSGASTGSGSGTGGTDTGSVAASTLAAPNYWFNQPVSTLSPKPITKKGGSMKTTSGSV
ncbi:hypothetical protein [Bradyrhizobium japonicum]|uniref:hypothetical protein n=1 Tax=Bradyrhizobium japonicum TaxID=375 RepID=UPI00200FA6EF|nr:hypothetical protein [Bradyrhizobium japonicum]UQD96108.1 hypothetical protein JEY30_31695 [Bradyrhizobium japonicum]